MVMMIRHFRAFAGSLLLLLLLRHCLPFSLQYRQALKKPHTYNSHYRRKSSSFHQASANSDNGVTEQDDGDEEKNDNTLVAANNKKNNSDLALPERRINLMWCDHEYCTDVVRERVVGEHNQIVLNGPATGQVAYRWSRTSDVTGSQRSPVTHASILLLVKPRDETLIEQAAEAVPKLTHAGIEVLLFAELAAKLKYNYGVDDKRIRLFEPPKTPSHGRDKNVEAPEEDWVKEMSWKEFPDLICTLGGDGLLMFASNLFQGPVPPIISIAGGSLGFLTPFSVEEMVEALQTALGIENKEFVDTGANDLEVFPPNMVYPVYETVSSRTKTPHLNGPAPKFLFGMGDLICMTIRMRLDCRIVNPEGIVRARYNVLNELTIDRGSSPYLSALECYCDDQHLTTVQADGIIFATPTGSTAYSMSAGGSVVHPAVPCILVTPICPHVLSFRSMVFPDHVVLRCYVPEDARSAASVAFDGKHRSEMRRGDSVQIQMSSYPVPTINRGDHSGDWLESLKRSFNFNTRPRQRPL